MLTVEQALAQVLEVARMLDAVELATADALGLLLAEDVSSDVDSPPHDKSIVDGYAIVATDLATGSAEFALLEEVTAGALPKQTVTPGATTRIMTGAPLPAGADAVVMIERTKLIGKDRVQLQDVPPRPGQNIMRRATSLRQGQQVLTAGTQLRPIELGVLAEVGRTQVKVTPRPRVALLATGNELVPAGETPPPSKIRNSNGPLLKAAVQATGCEAIDLGIARDEREALRSAMIAGLQADVLLLSGGVSAGVLDLVPGMLRELGIREVFHKVSLKPGKPIWFGIEERPIPRLVFGLPGNPVSTYVCFMLFVLPALQRLAGADPRGLARISGRLAAPFQHRGDRPTYHPAFAQRTGAGDATWQIELARWHGSSDLAAVSSANALAIFPAGERTYQAGDVLDALLLDSGSVL